MVLSDSQYAAAGDNTPPAPPSKIRTYDLLGREKGVIGGVNPHQQVLAH